MSVTWDELSEAQQYILKTALLHDWYGRNEADVAMLVKEGLLTRKGLLISITNAGRALVDTPPASPPDAAETLQATLTQALEIITDEVEVRRGDWNNVERAAFYILREAVARHEQQLADLQALNTALAAALAPFAEDYHVWRDQNHYLYSDIVEYIADKCDAETYEVNAKRAYEALQAGRAGEKREGE